jgi:uncharacterized protein YraI
MSVQQVEGLVTATRLRVRSGPGTDFPAVGGLENGDRIIVLGRSENNAWLAILYPDNLETGTGWVGVRFVELSSPVESLPIYVPPEPEETIEPQPTLTPTITDVPLQEPQDTATPAPEEATTGVPEPDATATGTPEPPTATPELPAAVTRETPTGSE